MDTKQMTKEEEKDYEGKISQAIADTYNFMIKLSKGGKTHYAICRICGKRFYENATGRHWNDRMINHADGLHGANTVRTIKF